MTGCPVLSSTAVLVPGNNTAGWPFAPVHPPTCPLAVVQVKVCTIMVQVTGGCCLGCGGGVGAGLDVQTQQVLSLPLQTHLAQVADNAGIGLLGLA